MTTQANLDLIFGALADSTRRTMLARLSQGDASVNTLVALTQFKQPTISKHLKVLANAGLVNRIAKAQYRMVQLNTAPLANALDWMRIYGGIYDDSLDRLGSHLATKMQNSSEKETP